MLLLSSLIRATTILLAGATLSYAGPLHEAILQGDLEKVHKRIALRDDVNDQDALGTPLFLALFTHNTEMARALIEAGADPNYAGGPISNVQLAVQIGDASFLRALLSAGASPNTDEDQNPLMAAALAGRSDLVSLLLKHGAEVERKNQSLHTALHFAAEKGDVKVIELLVEAGADIQALTDIGKPPIHFAAYFEHDAAVTYLQKAGWVPDSADPIDEFMADADPGRGKAEYDGVCLRCHPIKRDRYYLGSEMAGMFGRKIGGLEDFNYSPAFRSDTRIWTVETLNQYLAHPTQFIPGTWMSTAGIENERIRADMIAYIISLKDVPPE